MQSKTAEIVKTLPRLLTRNGVVNTEHSEGRRERREIQRRLQTSRDCHCQCHCYVVPLSPCLQSAICSICTENPINHFFFHLPRITPDSPDSPGSSPDPHLHTYISHFLPIIPPQFLPPSPKIHLSTLTITPPTTTTTLLQPPNPHFSHLSSNFSLSAPRLLTSLDFPRLL